MTKPRLTYFDMAVSRGEECRLAFVIAGVDFDDNRLSREQWAALKPTTPFGSVPVLDVEGHPPLAQSNAILAYIGRTYGVHPADSFEAARHEAVLAHVEDLRASVAVPRGADEATKKSAREQMAATTVPTWAGFVERQIGDGPFFAGERPMVVDIKLYMGMRSFRRGVMDHIPTTVFDGFPKLNRLYDAVEAWAPVKAWMSR